MEIPDPQYTQTQQPCWDCSHRLVWVKGRGFSYRIHRGEDGHRHKVHLSCWKRLNATKFRDRVDDDLLPFAGCVTPGVYEGDLR